jgi:hypothetical protein
MSKRTHTEASDENDAVLFVMGDPSIDGAYCIEHEQLRYGIHAPIAAVLEDIKSIDDKQRSVPTTREHLWSHRHCEWKALRKHDLRFNWKKLPDVHTSVVRPGFAFVWKAGPSVAELD